MSDVTPKLEALDFSQEFDGNEETLHIEIEKDGKIVICTDGWHIDSLPDVQFLIDTYRGATKS